ncbi:MAG: ribonuclease HII [Pseudomonadota bacterium]
MRATHRKMADDLALERQYGTRIAGIDEAGRGPWAGPVVAAAVVLDEASVPPGIDDSKRLSPRKRAALYAEILAHAETGIGQASVEEIDAMNIAQATALAMRRAVAALRGPPNFALIDGTQVPAGLPCRAKPLIGGDGLCLSVAAASILAKVTRDRIMVRLAQAFPGYGWETNAGYGVPAHAAALRRFGVTPHHRRSFRPIHNMLYQKTALTD